jgi:hypothetical protein
MIILQSLYDNFTYDNITNNPLKGQDNLAMIIPQVYDPPYG